MSIIYTLITRENVILADYTEQSGNFQQIANDLIKKLNKDCSMTIQITNDYKFHCINENNISYLCLAEKDCQAKVAFAFLEDIIKKFQETYTYQQQMNAIQYSLHVFSRYIQDRMVNSQFIQTYFNNDQNEKIIILKNNLQDVQEIMQDNLKQFLDRQEKIELLVNKTQKLQEVSITYKLQARKVKKELYWKNVRTKIFICVGFIIFLYVIFSFIFQTADFTQWF